MNQTRTRLHALGLLGRAFGAATDEELDAMIAALDDDHRDALEQLDATTPADLREAISGGRLDGTMESIAVVVADACLADCIEQLGADADNPSSDQLRGALPGLIERHGLATTRIMLASTVAGEANASAIIRDLLKSDETVKLPPAEEPPVVVFDRQKAKHDDPDRAAVVARRKELRRAKRQEATARREQSRHDRHQP